MDVWDADVIKAPTVGLLRGGQRWLDIDDNCVSQAVCTYGSRALRRDGGVIVDPFHGWISLQGAQSLRRAWLGKPNGHAIDEREDIQHTTAAAPDDLLLHLPGCPLHKDDDLPEIRATCGEGPSRYEDG